MKAFVVVSLYLFVLGAVSVALLPAAISTRYRTPARILVALVIAAWVIVVSISAAVIIG